MGQSCLGTGEEDTSKSELSNVPLSKKLQTANKAKMPLKSGSSFGPPLIYKERILLLSTTEETLDIISYDLVSKKWNSRESVAFIKPFDINECVYALTPNSSTIHIIHGSETMRLDLTTNTLELGDGVTTSGSNYPVIQRTDDKLYIVGAMSDDEKKSNDSFVYIPYPSDMKRFGKGCSVVNISMETRDYLFIMGGMKDYSRVNLGEEGVVGPHDEIWTLDIQDKKWKKQHLSCSAVSFGSINYRNEYVITFGGYSYIKKDTVGNSNQIHVLKLKTGDWHDFKLKLPFADRYFALFPNGSDVVHCFTFNGRYFTFKIEDIINNVNDEDVCYKIGTWNEMGKTVLPTKATSIVNVGPKADSDSD